jgi:PadR family transcriptional regulator AphA
MSAETVQASRTPVEYAILGLLSWRPLTGYDIKKMFEGSPALYWSGNNNQIYTALVRLHEQGLVNQAVELQPDRPARKIYSLNEQGQAVLRQWLLSEPEPPQLKNTFLIQLAWADQLSDDELDKLLGQYEAEIQSNLSMLEVQARQRNVSPSGALREAYINVALARTEREALLWSMIQQNRILSFEAELNWVRQLRRQLSGLANTE